jgi:hypothetical protein
MQHTTNKKRSGIPGRNPGRRKTITPTQRNRRTTVTPTSGLQNNKPAPRFSDLQTSFRSNRFNTVGLRFEPKMGFDILKGYGKTVDFTANEKIRAHMLYRCIRHLPGFIETKFTDINECVAWIHKEADRLIPNSWGLITDHGDAVQDNGVLTEKYKMEYTGYKLQIIYDEFEPSQGRWSELQGLSKWKGDRELLKAMIMCIHLIVFDFGFYIMDAEGTYIVMEFQDWCMHRLDEGETGKEYAMAEFEKKMREPFDINKHRDLPEAEDVIHYMDMLESTEELSDIHHRIAKPMFERIRKSKPNIKFLKTIIERHPGTDIGDWIAHVVMLKETKFCIDQYVASAYRYIDRSTYEEATSPMGCFGFVWDLHSQYTDDSEQYFNEVAGNYCILPFALNRVIDPQRGQIFETPDIPLGSWVRQLFSMNFKTLTYESDGYTKAPSDDGAV